MADYYSLLARAISALPQSAPEARQAVYERARKALFNQLRSIQPPVAESDIEAEGRALDEAIARLELEAVRETTPFASGKAAKPTEPQKPLRGASPQKPPKSGGVKPAETSAASEPSAPSQPASPQRPAAPLPPLPRPASNSRRLLMIAAVLTVVVGIVALVALQLRERPEDLARLTPEDSAADSVEGGKIVDRIGGEADRTTTASTGNAVSAARQSESIPAGPAVPVAQKAELWVAAPEEASKVKIYSGSVVWRLDNVGGGEGQPLTSAIRGDIDIPPAKMKASLVIQKNLDPTLSASHTINVTFQVASGSDLKGVKAIGPVQMRRPEAQSGEQVAGIPVPIMENKFLIGLLRGDREARNVTLLRSPMVVDLPMQLEDGRAATISMEKGPAGERVFADALEAWARR